MIEIVTADNSFLIRQGLKSILKNHSTKITGEIKNSSEFLTKINELKPDILILGSGYDKMATDSELSGIKHFSPKTKLLIISDCKEDGKILNAVKLGAIGYLTEECSSEEILKAIDSVSKGEKFFCNRILDIILEKKLDYETTEEVKDNLTEREIEIIKLITEKYSNHIKIISSLCKTYLSTTKQPKLKTSATKPPRYNGFQSWYC